MIFISYYIDMPPKNIPTFIYINLLNPLHTLNTYQANSLLCINTNTYKCCCSSSNIYKELIKYDAVFPLPDFSCAIVSIPVNIDGIDTHYINVGLLKPYDAIDYNSGYFNLNIEKFSSIGFSCIYLNKLLYSYYYSFKLY